MKICMPVAEDCGVESMIFGHFGSAPYFAIYDTDTQNVSIIQNDQSKHEHGSCMPVNALKGLNVEAVLCKGMGMRAASLLISEGIKPYLVDGDTIADAINNYKSLNVKLLDASNACQHHDCH